MSRCFGFVVDSTANPQQIETVEYGFQRVHNKSKSCTTNLKAVQQIHNLMTNPQQIHNFMTSHTACSTTHPQQIHNKSNKWSLSFSLETEGLMYHKALWMFPHTCLSLSCNALLSGVDVFPCQVQVSKWADVWMQSVYFL
jgi:hypothetical protein